MGLPRGTFMRTTIAMLMALTIALPAGATLAQGRGNSNQGQDPNTSTQGRSGSNPDGGGVDKPFPANGQNARSQGTSDFDGNNGCGNDDDRSDDNNGRCLGQGRDGQAAGTSTGFTGASGSTGPTGVAGATDSNDKVNVCHATGSDGNPYVFITVGRQSTEFEGHLRHATDGNPPGGRKDIIGALSADECIVAAGASTVSAGSTSSSVASDSTESTRATAQAQTAGQSQTSGDAQTAGQAQAPGGIESGATVAGAQAIGAAGSPVDSGEASSALATGLEAPLVVRPVELAGVQAGEAGAATILPVTGGEPFTIPILAFVALIAAGALMHWRLRLKS